ENSESGIPDSTTSNLPSKRVGEPTDKISSKKQKQDKKESHILKDLIKELSSKDPIKTIAQTESASELSTSPIIFLDLYIKIVNAEDQNKKTNQEIIRYYYDFGKALKDRLNYYKTLHPKQTAKMLVNDEVRNQLSQKVTETTLRKNTEKARKIYKLFNSIGGNDNMIEQLIQRVSISASTISKLSKDNIEHIVVAVIKNKQASGDGGRDIIVDMDGYRFVVQCKAWYYKCIGVKKLKFFHIEVKDPDL
ncbi:507_t:CDS:2, partial [Cetraspora pellucida]